MASVPYPHPSLQAGARLRKDFETRLRKFMVRYSSSVTHTHYPHSNLSWKQPAHPLLFPQTTTHRIQFKRGTPLAGPVAVGQKRPPIADLYGLFKAVSTEYRGFAAVCAFDARVLLEPPHSNICVPLTHV